MAALGHGGPRGSLGRQSVCSHVQAGKCLRPENMCLFCRVLVFTEAISGAQVHGKAPASRTQAVGGIECSGVVWLTVLTTDRQSWT